MRSILRDMRNLLGFSEEKLKTVKENISILREGEKINKVLATLRVFKGLFLAAKKKDEALSRGLPAEDVQNILKGITDDIKNGNTNKDDGTVNSVLNSVLSGITRLTAGIIKAVNRPEVGPMLDVALSRLNDAIAILHQLREALEKQEKDLELVIIWKDAVQAVITNVFSVDAEARKEADQDLFNEIKAIIEGGDVKQIYEAYNVLKDAAQNYLA